MRLALINVQFPASVILGDNPLDLVTQIPEIVIDVVNRKAIINGKPDTVSFSSQYTDEELPHAIAKRILQLYLRMQGWALYRLDEARL